MVVFCGLAFAAWMLHRIGFPAPKARCWEAAEGGAVAQLPWWQMQRQLWRQAKAKGTMAVVRRVIRITAGSLAAGFVGFSTSYLVMLPYYAARTLTGRPAPGGIPLTAVIGAVLGVFSLAKCLRYVAGRAPARGLLLRGPSFRLVNRTVPLRHRIVFNHKVYLYNHVRWAAVMAVLGGPTMVALGFSTDVASVPRAAAEDFTWTAQDWNDLFFLSSIPLALLVYSGLTRAVATILSPVHAAVAIDSCLPEREEGGPTEVGWAKDPLGKRRQDLDSAARALARAGYRVDRASRGHPLASVLLACSTYLQRFLAGKEALTGRYPAGISRMLTEAVIVLAGPATPKRTVALSELVRAFDDENQPRAELRTRTPGRWALLLGRTGDTLERYSRIGAAVWAIFSLIVVTVLIVTKNLDLTKFQLQK